MKLILALFFLSEYNWSITEAWNSGIFGKFTVIATIFETIGVVLGILYFIGSLIYLKHSKKI